MSKTKKSPAVKTPVEATPAAPAPVEATPAAPAAPEEPKERKVEADADDAELLSKAHEHYNEQVRALGFHRLQEQALLQKAIEANHALDNLMQTALVRVGVKEQVRWSYDYETGVFTLPATAPKKKPK